MNAQNTTLQELLNLPEPSDRKQLEKIPKIAKRIKELAKEVRYAGEYLKLDSSSIAKEIGVEECIVKKVQCLSCMLTEKKWNYGELANKAKIKYDDIIKIEHELNGNAATARESRTLPDYQNTARQPEERIVYKIPEGIKLLYGTLTAAAITISIITTAVVTSRYEREKSLETRISLENNADSLKTNTQKTEKPAAKKETETDNKTAAETTPKDEKNTPETYIPTDSILADYQKTGNDSLIKKYKDELDSAKVRQSYTALLRKGKLDMAAGIEKAYGTIMLADKDLAFVIKNYWERKGVFKTLANQDCSKERLKKSGLHKDYIDYANSEWEKAKNN
jgi:hypothetical protein